MSLEEIQQAQLFLFTMLGIQKSQIMIMDILHFKNFQAQMSDVCLHFSVCVLVVVI